MLMVLCAYLYLRLFMPFVPSLAGGIACMLSGYYFLFYNMQAIPPASDGTKGRKSRK